MVPGSPGINDQIGWKRCDSNVFQVPGSGFQVPSRCAGTCAIQYSLFRNTLPPPLLPPCELKHFLTTTTQRHEGG